MPDETRTLLAGIETLAPKIAARAAEIEALRDIPGDIVAALRALGVFRLFTPRRYGGIEADLPAGLDVFRSLARIDGAVGWTAMIGAGTAVVGPALPRATLNEMFRDGPNVILAGSTQPAGRAERVPGGWRVGGRWPFASGCRHADWIGGFCVMFENGRPLQGPAGPDGPPLVQGFALPAEAWEIEDTWHAAGLKGTGSHHIRLPERTVSDAHFFSLAAGSSTSGGACEPGPLYRSAWHMLSLMHGAVAIGIAEGAQDALVALARSGNRQTRAATAMRDSEIFQYELGRAAAELRAARLAYEAQAGSHWAQAVAGTLSSEAQLIEGQQIAVWTVGACLRVTETCFTLAGGRAVYADSPLQRRLRDIRVLGQHAMVQERHYVAAGKQLLDDPAATPELGAATQSATDGSARLRA